MKRFFFSLLLCMAVAISMAQYPQLTNIPTIYIETFGSKPVTSKTTYIYATMTYVNGSEVVLYDSLQIRGRGNSTWGLAKKPYRIKFRESTKFLGKGYAKNKSWTLLANHGDKSLLRNAVTFIMGDFLGQPFSPAAHFVDLVLNGTYLGNYQVSDQINVDNKRVEVYEQEEVATDISNITGGYLVEIDGFGSSEKVNFRTNKNLIVSVKSPDEDVINAAQREYIKQYLNNFENLLFSANFTDAKDGYRAIVDSATLVSWYIATELSANVDGFWSTYLYKDKDDPKLYFGPLWDYDIAYNNCNRVGDVVNRDMIEAGFGDDLTKVWMKRMVQDPWFNTAVNNAWKQKRSEGLEEYLYNYIDSMVAHLEASQQKNYSRYSISSRTYNEIYLYSTYADYIAQLKTFISDHMDFLTVRFSERANEVSDDGDDNPVVELKPFELADGYYYRIYNKGTNKVLDLAENGSDVVIWLPEYSRDTQLWEIAKVGDYYHLVNKATGMAFNDPSPTSAVGTPLNVAASDTGDPRQLWQFVTVNENGNYNIINAHTDHAINNSGGGFSDGNNILSYTNDGRNGVSNNRQWRITPEVIIPDYVAEEVKEALMSTIADAEAFLSGLTDDQVGEGIFCYAEEQIVLLRQMVADAKVFDSPVQDDYILVNVNLASQLDEAMKQQLPSSDKKYRLRHKSSGYYLHIAPDGISVKKSNISSTGQYYLFESTGNGNGMRLKSGNNLYMVMSIADGGIMTGEDSVANDERATLYFTVADGFYRIHTLSGLLGTDERYVTVYGNNSADDSEALVCSEWVIEEYVEELGMAHAALEQLIAKGKVAIATIDEHWIGDAVLQHSQGYVDALTELIALAEQSAYITIADYEAMMARLSEAMTVLTCLNAPDETVEYYLHHCSGYNLSCGDGLIVAEADTMDSAQRFHLLPVEGALNTYNIFTNGMYVTVMDGENVSLALTETPRDEWGHFVVTQVDSTQFTLQSAIGYLGTGSVSVSAGDACIGNAEAMGDNICWSITEATNEIIHAPTNSLDYMQAIDYAVVYDKEAQTLRFVSDDMLALANTNVRLYTVGGRLLYTFKAGQCQSVAELPGGTYVVQWFFAGMKRSVKFKK